MDDLVQWLGEQLDEDERIARTASGTSLQGDEWQAQRHPLHGSGPVSAVVASASHSKIVESETNPWDIDVAMAQVTHIAAHDPARVLREIDAKRALIARGGPFCTSNCDDPDNEPKNPDTNWTTLLEHHLDCGSYEAAALLAVPYDQRPGYKETWRP